MVGCVFSLRDVTSLFSGLFYLEPGFLRLRLSVSVVGCVFSLRDVTSLFSGLFYLEPGFLRLRLSVSEASEVVTLLQY